MYHQILSKSFVGGLNLENLNFENPYFWTSFNSILLLSTAKLDSKIQIRSKFILFKWFYLENNILLDYNKHNNSKIPHKTTDYSRIKKIYNIKAS